MAALFKHHDSLRLFAEIAQHRSFTDAAEALNMTKGAVSYQIKTLERALGVTLFTRTPNGAALTDMGARILAASRVQYLDIEATLNRLTVTPERSLTVGLSSYFASRWLSPRLMTFMQKHPDIQLRLHPMTKVFDLEQQGVDLAVRWGGGRWKDVETEPLMPMPAWPVANAEMAERARRIGLRRAFSEFTLLRDHDDSNAWSDWLAAAGLPEQTRADTLIIPDPNVRVQAVIDGQGVALMDALTQKELDDGRLVKLSETELSSYGYFLARPRTENSPDCIAAFVDWLRSYSQPAPPPGG